VGDHVVQLLGDAKALLGQHAALGLDLLLLEEPRPFLGGGEPLAP
jgi:hypothetical protein